MSMRRMTWSLGLLRIIYRGRGKCEEAMDGWYDKDGTAVPTATGLQRERSNETHPHRHRVDDVLVDTLALVAIEVIADGRHDEQGADNPKETLESDNLHRCDVHVRHEKVLRARKGLSQARNRGAHEQYMEKLDE